MEKQLKCVLLLSLKDMALRRVAVLLWSDSDILASILKFLMWEIDTDTKDIRFTSEEVKKEWRETLVDKVKDKVFKLELPKSLKKQMTDIVKLIFEEIRRWKKTLTHNFFGCDEPINLPGFSKLCWTTAGTIDGQKTAEELVHCDELNVLQRYAIACFYCLEDYIPLFWEELPKDVKELLYTENLTCSALQYCWPHILKGEQSKLDYLLKTVDGNLATFNQWVFECSVYNGNKTAAEYFLLKLTHEERESSVMRTAHTVLGHWWSSQEEMIPDVLCYLFSLMTPEQQMETIEAHPVNVLLCFFDLTWQDLFLENAGIIWTFLPPSGYGDLLYKMAFKLAHRFNNSGHYFPELFQGFFMQSPLDLKKCFFDQNSRNTYPFYFLLAFLESKDSESIEVMFRNVDATDKVNLVFNRGVLELFYDCMLEDRWHMVELCLREAALSKEGREIWKDAFLECNGWMFELGCRKWKRFFDFLDENDASACKEKEAQKCKFDNCCPE